MLLAISPISCTKGKLTQAPRGDATQARLRQARRSANAISRFIVVDVTKPAERPCNMTAELATLGISALRRSRYFQYKPERADRLHVFSGGARVLYMLSKGGEITPDADAGSLTVGVDLQFSREDPKQAGRHVLEVVVRRSVTWSLKKQGSIKVVVRKQLELALDEAVRRAEIQARSRLLPLAALIARVSSPDPILRDIAIQQIGFRKSKQALPSLFRALTHKDSRTVLRAVGAIAAIADRQAVPKLIARMQLPGTPTEISHAIVFALGDIGGAQAVAFLRAQLASATDQALKKKLKLALQSALSP